MTIENNITIAIERLRTFEPPEGYYLAFSGGKDSQCCYHLALDAGVKFDAHYNSTTVDPPELVRFIRREYPDVVFEKPEMTMWKLIEKKGYPPTRIVRYCCEILKERGGEGRIVITGVRRAESNKRKKDALYKFRGRSIKDAILLNDDGSNRQMIEDCKKKGKRVLNPIIDWSESDVWRYIKTRGLKYCELYDQGFKRLGCIGCPMAYYKTRLWEFKKYPQYKKLYLRAFEKMLETIKQGGRQNKLKWKTAEEVFLWWVYGKKDDSNQLKMKF